MTTFKWIILVVVLLILSPILIFLLPFGMVVLSMLANIAYYILPIAALFGIGYVLYRMSKNA